MKHHTSLSLVFDLCNKRTGFFFIILHGHIRVLKCLTCRLKSGVWGSMVKIARVLNRQKVCQRWIMIMQKSINAFPYPYDYGKSPKNNLDDSKYYCDSCVIILFLWLDIRSHHDRRLSLLYLWLDLCKSAPVFPFYRMEFVSPFSAIYLVFIVSQFPI